MYHNYHELGSAPPYLDGSTCWTNLSSTVRATEGGANTLPGEVTGKGENASCSAVLEGGYAAGTATAGLAQVEEYTVEPASAVEGDVQVGVSMAE